MDKQQRTAWLDNISNEELEVLRKKTNRKLLLRSFTYIPITIECVCLLVYLNKNQEKYAIEDDYLSAYNAVLVIVSLLAIRLYIALIVTSKNEKNSWQKKVVSGVIEQIKRKRIKIGEYSFCLNTNELNSVSTGDTVEISVSTKTDTVLSVKKI